MKAEIQNTLQVSEHNTDLLLEFNEILSCIIDSTSESGLRAMMSIRLNNFLYGFGGSHMWVKQIIDGEVKQQVLFVDFTQP